MATYTRQTVTTTCVVYHVPAPYPLGATWVEVYKAVSAIHAELREAGELVEGQDASDDRIWINAGDEEILVSYTQRSTS